MSSKREEERNEKIIRGLMKLPPNRRCINCNSVGPQYVCTNFWTFVCLSCSGIHREFTHRVKSVSMSKFTTQEVNSLQQGGNQRFREVYLKKWDMTRMRLPDSSNPERIRDFIRSVYVNKKYFGERASEKPPMDVESPMANNSDVRRPSSYHSFSQSPPYDYQYEERRYGKAALAPAPRRLGSDRFANDRDGSASRLSDFSVSSSGDAFRFDRHHPQRTSSSGSFGSFDSSSLPDTTIQEQQQQPAPQQLTRGPHQPVLTSSSSSSSSLPPLAKPTSPSSFNQQIDLFAGFNEQNLVNRPGPAFSGPNQVQVNKPGSPFNAPNQVQVNKPGPAFSTQNQVQVNKPAPAFNAQTQVQPNKPGPAFNTPNQVQVNKPGASINAPSQVQVNKPDAVSIDLFAGFNTQPSNEGWANFDSPQKNTQVQSSPVVVSTGEDLQRPVITSAAQAAPVKITAVSSQTVQTVQTHMVPFTSQGTSQVWDAYAFGASSGNINQLSVPTHTEPVSVPNAQLSPLNEVQIPVQSTMTPVPVPQTVSQAMVPTNQEKSETWDAFGESNTLVAPVPVGIETAKATGTTATQVPVQSTMPAERAPLPDTLFTNQGFSQSWNNAAVNHVYGSTSLSNNNNNVYGNVNVNAALTNNKPSVAYDQYLKMESSNMDGVYPNMNINNPPNIAGTIPASFQPLQGMPYQTTKSTNPFDFPDESDIQPNNNMYMDMSSLQAALPAQQAPFDFYSQFYTQNPSSTIPQGGMHLSGQAPNPQLPNLPPQSTYPSLGGNPFA